MLATEGPIYRPHFGVCLRRAPPRADSIVKCPEEVIYQLKSLRELAARVVATTLHLSARSKPVDLLDVIECASSEVWSHFTEKEIDCPDVQQAGGPVVGSFGLFPHCTQRMEPSMFSVDLAGSAKGVLQFLSITRGMPALWLTSNLEVSCNVRYKLFMTLQAQNLATRILPPIDVVSSIVFVCMLLY
jgi:hypothetical protein